MLAVLFVLLALLSGSATINAEEVRAAVGWAAFVETGRSKLLGHGSKLPWEREGCCFELNAFQLGARTSYSWQAPARRRSQARQVTSRSGLPQAHLRTAFQHGLLCLAGPLHAAPGFGNSPV